MNKKEIKELAVLLQFLDEVDNTLSNVMHDITTLDKPDPKLFNIYSLLYSLKVVAASNYDELDKVLGRNKD